MNQELNLQENIERWHEINPKAAVFLSYIEDSEEVNFPISLEEAKNWFSDLNLRNEEVLFVYGLGNGYCYLAAKEWLRKDIKRQIIFIEDDLKVIHAFFKTDLAKNFLQDQQCFLYFLDSIDENSSITEVYWQFLSLNFKISAIRDYENREKYLEIQQKIAYDATIRHALLDEYLAYGVSFFKNFYPNLLSLPNSFLGNKLFNQFKGIPAIICGAGPSLNKQLEKLNQLYDKALIFAGGSALNAFYSAKVMPHLGAGIDPNTEQVKRLSETVKLEIPFLYRNRMNHEAFCLVKGKKLYVTGSGGYDIARWFDIELGIFEKEELDEGFNIVNFCLDIARAFGCNPIIFVGMDLAYTDKMSYAKGVVADAEVKDETLQGEDLDSAAFLKEDINGNQVYTLWKWVAESNWIADFAKKYPELNIFNATEGGIGFPGIKNVTLKYVIDNLFSKSFEIESLLTKKIGEAVLLDVTEEKVILLLNKLLASLASCQDYLTTLIEEAKSNRQEIEKSKKVLTFSQSGLSVLAEIELADEIGYKFLLEVFNIVYSKILNKDLKLLKMNENLTDWEKMLKKIEINIKRLEFLNNVSKANISLIQHTLATKI